MNKIKKDWIYLALIGVAVIVMLVLLISEFGSKDKKNTTSQSVPFTSSAEKRVVTVEKETFVEVEKTITSEMIAEGLNDMGVMITAEYDFTQVEEYTKTKTYLSFITTQSNFIYSYDGVVSAGIDFNSIKVVKDDEKKTVTITVPKAVIQYTDIDYDSFRMYSEKEGLWNPMSIQDYNTSLVEFEKNAEEKAKKKGLLTKADENARMIIKNFVHGILDDNEYTVNFK